MLPIAGLLLVGLLPGLALQLLDAPLDGHLLVVDDATDPIFHGPGNFLDLALASLRGLGGLFPDRTLDFLGAAFRFHTVVAHDAADALFDLAAQFLGDSLAALALVAHDSSPWLAALLGGRSFY